MYFEFYCAAAKENANAGEIFDLNVRVDHATGSSKNLREVGLKILAARGETIGPKKRNPREARASGFRIFFETKWNTHWI